MELVEQVRAAVLAVVAARTTITYDELVASLPEPVDPAALAAALRTVSTEADAGGRGLVTAVVVRRGSGMPSGGFFRLAEERARDLSGGRRAAWEAELARVYAAAPAR